MAICPLFFHLAHSPFAENWLNNFVILPRINHILRKTEINTSLLNDKNSQILMNGYPSVTNWPLNTHSMSCTGLEKTCKYKSTTQIAFFNSEVLINVVGQSFGFLIDDDGFILHKLSNSLFKTPTQTYLLYDKYLLSTWIIAVFLQKSITVPGSCAEKYLCISKMVWRT